MSEFQGWVLVLGILGLLTLGMGGLADVVYRSQIIYEQAMKRIAEVPHE